MIWLSIASVIWATLIFIGFLIWMKANHVEPLKPADATVEMANKLLELEGKISKLEMSIGMMGR